MDVYILDTGINYDHLVFKDDPGCTCDNVNTCGNSRAGFGGYDVLGGDGRDCQGHGTHCAGLAVGHLTGVAYGAHVYRY